MCKITRHGREKNEMQSQFLLSSSVKIMLSSVFPTKQSVVFPSVLNKFTEDNWKARKLKLHNTRKFVCVFLFIHFFSICSYNQIKVIYKLYVIYTSFSLSLSFTHTHSHRHTVVLKLKTMYNDYQFLFCFLSRRSISILLLTCKCPRTK